MSAATLEMARLEERARIARDLHDGVSQTLYAIMLAAARAHALCERNRGVEAQHAIDGVLQLASAGQSELRATLAALGSDWAEPGGLLSALGTLASDVRDRGNLVVRLSLANEPDLPAAAKSMLAMICREALNNIIRHARARCVDINLEVDAHEVVLLIGDDGRGFDPAGPCPGHFGLLSMRERARAGGAAFDLTSDEGVGTKVCVRVPRAIAGVRA